MVWLLLASAYYVHRFWKPQQKYRGLDELKAVYRNTVGANAVLELGVLPDNTGSIPSDQMALLQVSLVIHFVFGLPSCGTP